MTPPSLPATPGQSLDLSRLIQTADALRRAGLFPQARLLYDRWVAENPDHPLLYATLFNHGVMLTEAGDLAAARDCLQRAVTLNPDFHPAAINLGRVLERLAGPGQALAQWQAAVARLSPVTGGAIHHKTVALNQSARVLEAMGQDAAAEAQLRQSLDIAPHQAEVAQHLLALRQRQCAWPVVQPWDRMDAATLRGGLSPLSVAAHTDDPLLHLAMAWHYNKTDVGIPATPPITDHWAARTARRDGPLRIGYLSSDLREHAVGHLMAEVFALHDPAAVEVHAYYCGPQIDGGTEDALHARFRASAHRWTDLAGLDDATAARRMADDGIQILVDVNGYTREGRPKLLALRPAPIIVNWLGFPGTTGSPYHHYIIADDWIIPPASERFYSERVVRLPCYQPNDRQRTVAAERPTREQAGLPAEGTVFCCFNGAHKITPHTFDRWLTILARVPDSVLWLLSSTDDAHARLRAVAAERGVAPERLVFAPKLANPQHLARYPLADLFLDTCPYGAHTTASDALWMGVPVLTLDGRGFAARVCGSLVRAAGLPELVCAGPRDYVDRAVALGRDPDLRQHYRDRLAANRDTCTLFDMPGLVRSLEGLYAGMWADCLQGRLPRPDLRNLDVYWEVGTAQDHEGVEVQALADYTAWWREPLARRHAHRPIPPDGRMWGEEWGTSLDAAS
ncbi:glycosyl transferase [Azospirillum sp. B4]|uniref:O-linked N-acetylglucosamine transferase, SPINDLY family protein n=1 Tax=Azospirillum sp. B4 TaxID=95605 RepID=UPI0005CB326C|nr:glycosyl transferase [Azospirillum sp. B4]